MTTQRPFPQLAALLLAAALCLAQGGYEKRVVPVDAKESQRFHNQAKVALVVGVSKYPAGSGLPELRYAASDAADMAALLRQQGYQVQVLTDGEATRGAIQNTLKQLSGAVDPDQGTFLFYFSGHGFAVKDKNYLAPVSASASDLDGEGLPVDAVQYILNASKARRRLMLLDACRSVAAPGEKGAGGRSFSALRAAEGLRILNSSRLGNVSYESPELRHGVFTAFLLQGLRGQAAGPDGMVTFFDLAGYVTNGVRQWGSEHHKIQVPFDNAPGEAAGDFLMAGPTPAEVAAAPIQPASSTQQSQQDESARYTAAILTRDPAQMEAAADTMTTKIYADSLRSRAQMLRNAGTRSNPLSGVDASAAISIKTRFNALNARVEADTFARRGNFQQALPLYQQAAAGGNTEAMIKLADIYYKGSGTDVNYPEAAKWYQKAADEGEPIAMGALAALYVMGRGVPQDRNQAVVLYRKAAGLGNAQAKDALQRMGIKQ